MNRKPQLNRFLVRQPKRPKASSSHTTPDSASEEAYDVFLNFRGPDSRHTVADILYRRLTDSGFRVFLDDEEIRRGEVIEGELLRAITNSRIYIPIFSKGYASSKWCLRELAKMIDCWKTSIGDNKKVILPIFYDVGVSEDVKLNSKAYTTALQKHEDELGEDVVKPWKDALRKVATIKGWNLRDHSLFRLADLINKEVSRRLPTSEAVTSMLDCLVGMDKLVEDIMELLDEGSPDVRFIVIHGMGGVGKTTLANAVFDKISSQFQGRCFLKDVRRSACADDMIKLQEKLLLDILNLNFIKVSDIHEGTGMIRESLCEKNVLMVLDDVDKRDHLLYLAAKSSWFGPKSRIIITTRNIEFLPTKDDEEYCFYEMKEMDRRHAFQLFCRHAFVMDKHKPPFELYNISTEIVDTLGGLPLSLQVIASSLYNQGHGTWKLISEKLKEAANKDVHETSIISYQALEYEKQQIFLDIACFFNGENIIDPIYFWEACDFYPRIAIKILEQRSLIKVDNHDKTLWMHDQLRDLGRAIAQPKMPALESQLPAKCSRLWSAECALDALRKKEVDKSIIALKLVKLDAGCCFAGEEFARAHNLRFLELQGGNFEGNFKDVFQQLRWLSWSDCPPRLLATNLSFNSLVILKLSRSQLAEDWNGWGVFMEAKRLKVLHLEDCKRLKKTPDFSTFLGLERLILRDCSGLEEIDGTINKLKNLNYLEISNNNVCYGQYLPEVPARLQLLPESIGSLKSLAKLKIENAGLVELHPSIGELLSLKILSLRCPQLGHIPNSLGKLKLLEMLDLSYSRVNALPDSIGDLSCLKILRMESSAIKYLPDAIGRLESLEELNLCKTQITQLPETIGELKRLKVMSFASSNLKMFPKALPKLENVETLDASHCHELDGKLPNKIGKVSSLRVLDLNRTTISRVPRTINQLLHLHKLTLEGIHKPQELSKLPTSLISLTVRSSSLDTVRVPDLSNMTNLVRLELLHEIGGDSPKTFKLHRRKCHMKWLASLLKLKYLRLHLPDLAWPPTKLSSLSNLQELDIDCFDPRSLPCLPSSLRSLLLKDVKSPIDWQHLSCLNNLSRLVFDGCRLKEIKIECLEQLHRLELYDCALERLCDLSCLKGLQVLAITDCRDLVEIEGVGDLKFLRSLSLKFCTSIRWLPGLSRLRKLEYLRFYCCISLESIPEVDEEVPCHLIIKDCKLYHDFDGLHSERLRKGCSTF